LHLPSSTAPSDRTATERAWVILRDDYHVYPPCLQQGSSTGALSLLAGAPVADRLEGGLIAIDGQGKFLFELNLASDNISMFQIDGSTGALETWISICWRSVPWRLESFRSRISGPVCCIFRA
jgi:hypothetical protein